MGTAIVGISLCGIVTLILRHMIRERKSGKSAVCGGDCGHCKGCH